MRDDLRTTLEVLAERGRQRDPDEVFGVATRTAGRRRRVRRAGAAAALGLAATIAMGSVLLGDRSSTDVVVGPGTSTVVPQSVPPEDTVVSERDRVLVAGVIEFARATDQVEASTLAFADEGVQLGLGQDLLVRRAPAELKDPTRWVLPKEEFRGHVGPFSALKLLADRRPFEISAGPHPHCASPPVPPPAAAAHLRRLSVQPSDAEECLKWFTVDIYVDAQGVIHAVTLDLWAP